MLLWEEVRAMKLENPKLYRCPRGWESRQKSINRAGSFLVLLTLTLGIIFWFLPIDDTPGYSMIIISIGIFFLIITVYTNFDRKDSWYRDLPFNPVLFDRLVHELGDILKKRKYRFTTKERFGISTALNPRTRRNYALEYRLLSPNSPYLKVMILLQIIHHKYGEDGYHFPLVIKNIRMENLKFARQLAQDISYALYLVKYKRYREVH